MIRWLVARLWNFACRVQAWQDRRDDVLWLAPVRDRLPVRTMVRYAGRLWRVHGYDLLTRKVRLHDGPGFYCGYEWTDIPLHVRVTIAHADDVVVAQSPVIPKAT